MTVPGVVPITVSVLVAELGDGKQYGCSRNFAASVGLVPRPYSTDGKANLLRISKRRQKHSTPAGSACPGSHAAARVAVRSTRRLGPEHVGAVTLERRSQRPRKQACSHRPGAGDSQHHLRSGTGCHASVTTRPPRLLLYRSQSIWFCDR
jgi:hypothetical protein